VGLYTRISISCRLSFNTPPMHSPRFPESDAMKDFGDDLRSLRNRHSRPAEEQITVGKRDVAVSHRPKLSPPGLLFQNG
jgi:hypothetical protein